MTPGKSVLVVDDEEVLRMALRDMLTKAGFEVFVAKNGEEGLALALQNKPDLMLIDLLMPVMDGMELLYKLRKDEWGKDVGVIILTNVDDVKGLRKIVEETNCEYIVKTEWQISEIVEKVKEKIEI